MLGKIRKYFCFLEFKFSERVRRYLNSYVNKFKIVTVISLLKEKCVSL